jgi:hypothetical protein
MNHRRGISDELLGDPVLVLVHQGRDRPIIRLGLYMDEQMDIREASAACSERVWRPGRLQHMMRPRVVFRRYLYHLYSTPNFIDTIRSQALEYSAQLIMMHKVRLSGASFRRHRRSAYAWLAGEPWWR